MASSRYHHTATNETLSTHNHDGNCSTITSTDHATSFMFDPLLRGKCSVKRPWTQARQYSKTAVKHFKCTNVHTCICTAGIFERVLHILYKWQFIFTGIYAKTANNCTL